MKLARVLLIAALPLAFAGAALAMETAPQDVKFNEDEFAVTESLTGVPGDAAAGAAVFSSRKQGNCLACHENTDQADQLFQGNVGPSLDGVADRWEPAQLRAIVADAKQVFGPDTVMPGFYSLNVGATPAKDFVGKTILSAQEVEDVVAYLTTLKEAN